MLIASASFINSASLKRDNYLEDQEFSLKLRYFLSHLSRYWSFSAVFRKKAEEINEWLKDKQV